MFQKLKRLMRKVYRKVKKMLFPNTVKAKEKTKKTQNLPDTPYGPKISSITDAGIEFYWKKVENASGYEVFRSYSSVGGFEKIAQIDTRSKGVYVDADFDKTQKQVFYKSRSFLKGKGNTFVYSDFTESVEAVFRDKLMLERDVTYMYDGTSRRLKSFYGWGEVSDAQWSSDREDIAVIRQDGTIEALASGEAVLTCTSKSLSQSATATVVVNRASMEPLDTGERRYSFDPATGCWENPGAEKTNDAVIMMVGDMMCGSAQTKKQYTEKNGWSFNDSYTFVKDVTAKSDFAVGNLETLMASGWPYMIDEVYIDNMNNCNNPSRYLDAVLFGGFDAVTMSNNHNCDGGVRALMDTISEVDLRNIPHTGVFRNAEEPRFMIVDVNGIKVGFLAYMSKNTGFNGKDAGWTQEEKDILLNVFTQERARRDIEACKKAGAEYIIVYMHWGKKNFRNITKVQKREAEEVADAGADYIVGANPHVVQVYQDITTEDGRTVPCFYSVGNFQAYMDQIPGNRDSVMVRIRLTKNTDGKVVLEENTYIPYHTYTRYGGCRWAPMSVGDKPDAHIDRPDGRKYFQRITRAVGNQVNIFESKEKTLKSLTGVDGMEKYVTKYTVQEVCDILDIKLPKKYQYMADATLTNVSSVVNSLAKGGGFVLYGKTEEERREQLDKALAKKPKFIFAGRSSRTLERIDEVPHVFMKSPFSVVTKLSGDIRRRLGLTVIGVTGSLGKTTTKEMVHSVLKQQYVADKNFGNRNNAVGIFNSLQTVGKDVQFYVQEFGVAIGSQSMESKISCCVPNAAIITNISDPHLDVFGTRENILKEKIKLVTEMEAGCPAILNFDDELLKKVELENHPIISFAVENKEADYYAENIQCFEDYITFEAVHNGRRTPITLHSRGKHNIGNALASMAVGEWFGMSIEKIVEGIEAFRSEGIRQSLVNIGGYKIYVDAYNTAPISLLGAIDVLQRLPVEDGGKRIAVLGDIVRLGDEERNIHRHVGEKIGESKIDLVFCFGNDNAKIMADAICGKGIEARYTDSREELNEWMRSCITRKDVTLVKGPVARLLSKSLDQVFGTSFHVGSEHHDNFNENRYRMDIIYEKEDHTKTMGAILRYNGDEEQIVIPSQTRGVDIFCLAKNCFEGNTTVREVTIPEPVRNIAEKAFAGCVNLQKVSLPPILSVIENHAFYMCESLQELTLPEGTIHIGDEAFAQCKKLGQIKIPASVGYIGEKAFEGTPLTKIICAKGSYAHRYAAEKALPFELTEN